MIPRQTLTWWTQVGRGRRGVGEGAERLKRALTSKRAQKDQDPHRRATHWTWVSWAAREIRKWEVKASVCVLHMHHFMFYAWAVMQPVWKPAEWLHFYADSMPVLPYFRLCIGSLSLSLPRSLSLSLPPPPLSLYVLSLTASRPNPKWYDRGGRPASMQPTSIWIYCRVLFYCLEQKQFNTVVNL